MIKINEKLIKILLIVFVYDSNEDKVIKSKIHIAFHSVFILYKIIAYNILKYQ